MIWPVGGCQWCDTMHFFHPPDTTIAGKSVALSTHKFRTQSSEYRALIPELQSWIQSSEYRVLIPELQSFLLAALLPQHAEEKRICIDSESS